RGPGKKLGASPDAGLRLPVLRGSLAQMAGPLSRVRGVEQLRGGGAIRAAVVGRSGAVVSGNLGSGRERRGPDLDRATGPRPSAGRRPGARLRRASGRGA